MAYKTNPQQPMYGPPVNQPYGTGTYYTPPQQNRQNVPPYRQRPDMEYGGIQDDGPTYVGEFNDSAIRAKFVRKVYTILSMQLLFTTLFNIPFIFVEEVQEFAAENVYISFVGLGLFMVPYFALVCCESTRRVFPTNMILLCLMTLGLAIICGFVSAKMSTEVVLYAALATTVVTISITILAIFCPFDITSCAMVLCVLSMIVFIFGIITMIYSFLVGSRILHLVWSGVVVVLFSLFLMFDTQAIMGGRRIELSPEEYILAAVQLYVDIIQIFLHLLNIIGACTESN